jgi:predicted phage-related endonuclease
VWLAHRRELIGGSDLAKLFGQSKYGGPFDLWADKTGRLPDNDGGNAAMRRGQLFEDAVIKLWVERFAEFHIEHRRAGLIRSKRYPHLGATVDRLSICDYFGEPRRCVIEAKTQNDMTEWDGDDGVPVAFEFQGGAQLLATGRDHVHYVVMGPRWRVEHRILRRDDEFLTRVGERVEQFWADHIVTGESPDVDHQSRDTLAEVYRGGNGTPDVEVTDELIPHLRALAEAQADLDDAKQRVDQAAAVVQLHMGDAESLVWPAESGEPSKLAATWNVGKTIDGANADWRRQHAELVAQYTVPGPDVLDVAKLVENHPELLLPGGGLRRRRTFKAKPLPSS